MMTSISINTLTGDYATADTWTDIPDGLIEELRHRLGEPTARQLIPVDVLDRVVDDPAMVAWCADDEPERPAGQP